MSRWSQGREVSKVAWSVIRENRYFLTFPLVGFLLALIPIAVLWIPAILSFAADANVIGFVLLVLGMLGLAVATTYTSAATVAAADEELAGRDSSVGAGFKAAFAHSGRLLPWAVVEAVVGLLISLVRGNGEGNIVGVILRSVLAAAASVVWELITFFALPVIMFENLGPIAAIKRSASLFKERWGAQLAGGVRIGGVIFLVAMLPALLVIIGGVLLSIVGAAVIGIPLAIIGLLVFVAANLVASVMREIYSVALYRYALDGQGHGAFTAEQLSSTVRTK